MSHYKNKPSIVLKDDTTYAEFLANPGGKLVSLKNRKTGYEFLVQRPGDEYREQPFDGVYTDGECSGFDEMFPTIDMAKYHDDPWKETKLADHGEVWSLPWNVLSQDAYHLNMSVNGVRIPYILQKNISLENGVLHYRYSLTNLTPFDFDYLWAGHLMVNVQEGTKLSLPDDAKKAVTVLSNGSSKFGDFHDWPNLKDKDGNAYRGDIVRSESVRGFEKYYFTEPLENGWCKLEYPDGNRFHVTFSVTTVPYLGILMNEKGWDGLYNIIIEPCSICYDRPDLANELGQRSTLPGNGRLEWTLSIDAR